MLENLKKNPILLAAAFGLTLPFLIIFFQGISSYNSWKNAVAEIGENLVSIKEQRQKNSMNQQLARHYEKKDSKYLEKEVETLHLLTNEQKRLEKHIQTYSFISETPLQERLHYLKNQNKILFNEKTKTKFKQFQETVHALASSIEVDDEDLLRLFSLLEGGENRETRPLIQITDFSFNRKITNQEQATYEVQLKLVQRDFL